MGKTGKWLKNFLTGKKDKGKEKGKFVGNQNSSNATENPTTPTSTTPKEKRRWSFRRSSATATASRELNFADQSNSVPTAPLAVQSASDAENEQRKHAIAVAAATAAAADVAVAAAQAAAAAAIHLNSVSNGNSRSIEEAAAIKIQSAFRSFLARKALCALRGLVKLQALVRGHLVRKQATATLRCMQALVTAQARARCQRICKSSELTPTQRLSTHRQLGPDEILRQIYNEMDRGLEENIKIVEMDVCESKGNPRSGNSNSNSSQHERPDRRFSTYYSSNGSHSKEENCKVSPAPSALTEFSPRTCSGHFEDFSFGTAQSSPHYYSAVSRPEDSKLSFSFPRPAFAESMSHDYPLYPNYMANTESSRAKARSHSAPKQRPDSLERQPSRRRASVEGRNVPRPVRMQRSSSHVGVTAQNYHYPWSIKLDRSTVSLIESECGSTTSTVLTNNDYCRSLAAFDANGNRY